MEGRQMRLLVAYEESQRVCMAFREKGHEAYSCDLVEPSGGHPEWHILGDVLPLLDGDCSFRTMDGHEHTVRGGWDMIIAHPPCTYLSNVATRHHSLRMTSLDKINARTEKRIEAMKLFMRFVNAKCRKIVIENPIGVMNTCYRKPDQIIDPYQFAESEEDEDYVTKSTCLWIKGLPPLLTNQLPKPDNHKLFGTRPNGRAYTWEDTYSRKASVMSKTFEGIARAMAEQWG